MTTMAPSEIDLNRVAMFVRIAEAGGVSAAAARAKLPKSSVSRALTQLEDELGLELVVRKTKRFQLTEAGQYFYEAAAKGLEAVRAARDELRPEVTEPRGAVRIAAPPAFATFVVAPAIVAFTRRHPRVDIELVVTAAKLDPSRDDVDIALRIGGLEDSSSMVRKLGALDAGIFASKRYLAEHPHGAPRRPSDLSRYECILQAHGSARPKAGSQTWTLHGPGGKTEVRVRGRIMVDDQSAAIAAAAAGGGLVVLPLHAAGSDPSAATLRRVLPEVGIPGASAQLLYARARHVPLRISMLCDLLVETCKTTCTSAEHRSHANGAAT